MRGALAAVVLASLAAAAPPASAAGTALYVHVLDAMQDMPMSVQAPPANRAVDVQMGAGTSSLACVPNPTPAGQPFQDYHTFYGYATPDRVAYTTALGSGLDMPRPEPVRGIAADVALAGSSPTLHWYWSTQAAPGQPAQAPLVVPNVVVHAALRAGDAISLGDAAYNSGPLLAEGESAPALLAGEASQGVTHSRVGDRDVYEFTVPLQLKADAIPAALGYNLRVDTWMAKDNCPGDGYAMPNVLALHSSAGHRPRLELATVQPLSIEPVQPREANGTWTFDVRLASPWGRVDGANVTASVVGPDGQAHDADVADPFELPMHCHCDEFGAYASHSHDARVTWNVTGAPPGGYRLELHATNLQGTAQASASVPFAVAGSQESPGVAPALLLAGLVALAIALRRRS